MKLIYGIAILIFSGFLFMNHSGGRAAAQGEGNTGAPGDNRKVCKNCHNSASVALNLEINLLDTNEQIVEKYRPEEEYIVQVKFNPIKGSPLAFGFQMVCLDAELNQNGQDLKNWIDNEANNYKISRADNGRTYVEHDQPSQSRDFKVKWKAPAQGTGTVSFYSAGNGVNLNGSTSGDGSTNNSASFEEDQSTSIESLALQQLSVYPTHFNEFIHVAYESNEQIQLELIYTDGSIVEKKSISGSSSWDLTHLKNGMYHLRISSSESKEVILKKIIKF